MKATLKSVAQEVGVSVTTVSRVLNNKPCRVSEETRENIMRAVVNQHYMPNQTARSLKTQQSFTFGFLVPDISNAFYSELARSVEEAAYQCGYHLLLGNSNSQSERDYEYLQLFAERSVDAVIMIPSASFDSDSARLHEMIREYNVPVVVIDRFIHSDEVYNINIDHALGSYLAARHLLSLGHNRIGLGTGPQTLIIGQQRLAGYQRALEEFGIPYDPELVVEDSFDIPSGAAALQKFLAHKATAICCSNDMMALGVYQECARFNLHLPEDLSVVGFDNIDMTDVMTPPLTSVALPVEEMAHTAVEIAIRLSQGAQVEERQRIFKPNLVIRRSTSYLRQP